MKNILGIHSLVHDPGAALVTAEGRVMAIAEERLNRTKHSPNIFPQLSIRYLLEACGLTLGDVDLIVVDRVVDYDVAARVIKGFEGELANIPVVAINHHESHAASCFYASGFEDAAILVVDGAGEMLNHRSVRGVEGESCYVGEGRSIRLLAKSVHPRTKAQGYYRGMGLGKLYTHLTRYIGFGPYQEGKTMGLAPYGKGALLGQHGLTLENLLYFADGEVWTNPSIAWPRPESERSALRRTLGGVRRRTLSLLKGDAPAPTAEKIEAWIQEDHSPAREFPGIRLPRGKRVASASDLPDDYYTEIAHIAQTVVEEGMVRLGRWIQEQTGKRRLCVAGGVALNIDANSRLVTDCGFDEVFTQPASSDSGSALGNALWGAVQHGSLGSYVMRHAYLGREYSDEEVRAALPDGGWEKPEDVLEATSELLAAGKVVGWFHGGSEYGPRALGHRSILMDPRQAEHKDVLNMRVKKRESFRPFAPVVPLDQVSDYFDLPSASPFMLLKGWVKPEKRGVVPAITHVDGSARVQTLMREDNGRFYDLVETFGKLTGVSVLLNTSFNGPGEPIVESPADAVACFHRLDMDALVLEDYIVKKGAAQ